MPKRIKVAPSKASSKVVFFVGLIFVLIGFFVVIPTFGLFGIFWTAIAAFITYTHYKNGYTEDGFGSHEIIIEDDENKDYKQNDTIKNKLIQLESLYNQRLITQEEYEQKRKEILEKL